jgi:hypothetical protein
MIPKYTKYENVDWNRTDFTNVSFMLLLRTLLNNFANLTWYGLNN